MNRFAVAFRKARLTSDKTFREIAEHIGKSIGYLSDIENGRKNPPDKEIVKKIEEFLGVKDGSLSAIAEELRSTLPSNLNNLVRARPQLGQLLLRGDELPDDELEKLLQELSDRMRKSSSTNESSNDTPKLFLNNDNLKYFGRGYKEI